LQVLKQHHLSCIHPTGCLTRHSSIKLITWKQNSTQNWSERSLWGKSN